MIRYPCNLVYGIWWASNSSIFQNADIPPEISAGLIVKLTQEYKMEPKLKNPRAPVMPQLDSNIPWAFFDGASQGDPPVCVVGAVLYMNQNHYFHIR
jgi:hypothetical protein